MVWGGDFEVLISGWFRGADFECPEPENTFYSAFASVQSPPGLARVELNRECAAVLLSRD